MMMIWSEEQVYSGGLIQIEVGAKTRLEFFTTEGTETVWGVTSILIMFMVVMMIIPIRCGSYRNPLRSATSRLTSRCARLTSNRQITVEISISVESKSQSGEPFEQISREKNPYSNCQNSPSDTRASREDECPTDPIAR